MDEFETPEELMQAVDQDWYEEHFNSEDRFREYLERCFEHEIESEFE